MHDFVGGSHLENCSSKRCLTKMIEPRTELLKLERIVVSRRGNVNRLLLVSVTRDEYNLNFLVSF